MCKREAEKPQKIKRGQPKMRKKYLVIAIRWNASEKVQEPYVAGEFTDFINATLFRDAYNKYYSANAKIVEA